MGLKKVGQTIGVPDLNFYYARHSMASICANRLGIDIARVDEMLNLHIPEHTRSLSGSLLGYKTIP